MEEKAIIQRVLEIKKKLTQLESIYKNSDPLQQFDFVKTSSVSAKSKDELIEYPNEYKIFLELIGEVYVAFAGAFMLEVCLPKNLDDCWWISDQKITDSDNYRIIAYTDNDDIYDIIYDVTKNPFERHFTDQRNLGMSFLDIVEKKIKECLS
jgi:hypothetical protein